MGNFSSQAAKIAALKYAKNQQLDTTDYCGFSFNWNQFQIAQEFLSNSKFSPNLEETLRWFVEKNEMLLLSESWREFLSPCRFGWNVGYNYLEFWYRTKEDIIFSQAFTTLPSSPVLLTVYLPNNTNNCEKLYLINEVSKNRK